MSNKILTVFLPGAYGTYLSWAVASYSNLNTSGSIIKPFNTSGSAHLYRKFDNKQVRPSHVIVDNYKKIIYIKPNYSKLIDYLDNQYSKELDSNEFRAINSFVDEVNQKLKSKWAVNNLIDADLWIKRELLSFFLGDLFDSQIKQYEKLENEINQFNYNSVSIAADDILNNHILTLNKIFSKLNLSKIINDEIILETHQEYLSLQKHTNKSKYIDQLLQSCYNNQFMEIKGLTLFDEAYIQHLLRTQHIELTCYGLNKFPENTQELSKLLDYSAYKGNASPL